MPVYAGCPSVFDVQHLPLSRGTNTFVNLHEKRNDWNRFGMKFNNTQRIAEYDPFICHFTNFIARLSRIYAQRIIIFYCLVRMTSYFLWFFGSSFRSPDRKSRARDVISDASEATKQIIVFHIIEQ